MKFCRDVSSNNTYDEIYLKAADMMSPEEISMPGIVKHQTMRSNATAESPRNYYLRNLYYPFLDSVILQLDQRFPGHAETVMQLSSLLPVNVVTANFCEVEPAVNLFLPLLQATLIKVKAQLLLRQRFCQNLSDIVVWKRACKLSQANIFLAINILYPVLLQYFQYLLLLLNQIFVYRTTTDKIRFTNNCGSSSPERSVLNVYL